MTPKQRFDVYAASCVTDGGIFRYSLSEDGRLTPVSALPLDRPMYFQKLGDKRHISLRAVTLKYFGGAKDYM